MALGKSVFGKSLDLLKDLVCKLLREPVRKQALHQAHAHLGDATIRAPRSDGAPESVGLAGSEARKRDGDLHDLFLKKRNSKRSA